MWCLWNLRHDEVFHKLLCNAEYKVGRRGTAIVIKDDPSVSRQHALLLTSSVVGDRVQDIAVKPQLRVKDLGSKYGTWVNNTRLTADEEKILQQGDEIKFGQLNSCYQVRYEEPIVAASSCLRPDCKKLLKQSLVKLGGRLLPEWMPVCTHLVMESVTLTIKTACALLAAKPIVTPAFIEETVKRIEEGVWEPLDPSEYIPNIDEYTLRAEKRSFDRNPARQTLFSGKTFYFFDRVQYKRLHIVLSSGGGKVVLVEDDEGMKDAYAANTACVMKPPGGNDHPVVHFLAKKGLRVIPESDVGLAVVYCSTEKFCNARSTASAVFWRNTSMDTQGFTENCSQADVYVAETESTETPASHTSNVTTHTILETKPSTSTAGTVEVNNNNTTAATVKQSFFKTRNINETSPIKSARSMSQSPSQLLSKQNGKSPSKIRKKDAAGSIPLQFYFPRKRQNDDSGVNEITPAKKMARLLLEDAEDNRPITQEVHRPVTGTRSVDEMIETEPKPVLSKIDNGHDSRAAPVEKSQIVLPDDFHVEIIEPMICAQRSVISQQTSDVPNFKRFKKAHQVKITGLPQFIRTTTVVAQTVPYSTFEEEDEDDCVFFGEPLQSKRRKR